MNLYEWLLRCSLSRTALYSWFTSCQKVSCVNDVWIKGYNAKSNSLIPLYWHTKVSVCYFVTPFVTMRGYISMFFQNCFSFWVWFSCFLIYEIVCKKEFSYIFHPTSTMFDFEIFSKKKNIRKGSCSPNAASMYQKTELFICNQRQRIIEYGYLYIRYTKDSNVSRARSNFYHGRRDFLLLTERFHFYHR